MKNILIIIFIVLFSFILLNSIYVKATCNRLIEGLEQDDTDLDIKERFKRLEDKINKIQDQIVKAEKTNEDNAENIIELKKNKN
jgi:hypothetical protein